MDAATWPVNAPFSSTDTSWQPTETPEPSRSSSARAANGIGGKTTISGGDGMALTLDARRRSSASASVWDDGLSFPAVRTGRPLRMNRCRGRPRMDSTVENESMPRPASNEFYR